MRGGTALLKIWEVVGHGNLCLYRSIYISYVYEQPHFATLVLLTFPIFRLYANCIFGQRCPPPDRIQEIRKFFFIAYRGWRYAHTCDAFSPEQAMQSLLKSVALPCGVLKIRINCPEWPATRTTLLLATERFETRPRTFGRLDPTPWETN